MNSSSDLGRTPAVSVIIPAYRTTEYISDALDSVLSQTFTDYEVLVVNDGCPDTSNLEKVLAPYQRHIRYFKQDNGGPSSARNTAILASRAPLLALLDSDDVWEPDYLAVQVGFLRGNPYVDAVYSDAIFFGAAACAGRSFMEFYPSRGEVTFSSVVERRCWIFGGLTVRRDAVVRAGLFDPSIRNGEDLELWLRILEQGGKLAYHHKPLVKYRFRPGSTTRNAIFCGKELLGVLRKVGELPRLTESDRCAIAEALRRETAWLHHVIGRQAFFDGDMAVARANLAAGNAYFKSRKTSLILFLIRLAPNLLRQIADFRYGRSPAVEPKS